MSDSPSLVHDAWVELILDVDLPGMGLSYLRRRELCIQFTGETLFHQVTNDEMGVGNDNSMDGCVRKLAYFAREEVQEFMQRNNDGGGR